MLSQLFSSLELCVKRVDLIYNQLPELKTNVQEFKLCDALHLLVHIFVEYELIKYKLNELTENLNLVIELCFLINLIKKQGEEGVQSWVQIGLSLDKPLDKLNTFLVSNKLVPENFIILTLLSSIVLKALVEDFDS